MRFKLITVFTFISIISLSAQTVVQWTDSTVIASTTLPITAPRIAFLGDGTPLVTWGTSGNPARIWCSRYENNAFTTPVSVVQSAMQPALYGFGGYDVAVSGNQVFVVFEQTQQGILLTTSMDGGLTFNPPVTVQGAVSGGANTLASIVIDGTGNPVISYILDKGGATYQVKRSSDGGQTFLDAVIGNAPSPGGVVCECCTSDMLASGDSIWMIYRNNNQNLRDIWVSRSTDLATTFDSATDVDSTDWVLNFCPIAGPQMARAGDSLVTVWTSGASGKGRIYMSTLHAGTMQFGDQLAFPAQVDQSVQSQPDITASGDTIGLVFVEKSREIYFHYSTNGSMPLPSQSTLFKDGTHTLQYPAINFRNGVFHLVYADPTSDKVLYRRGVITQSSAIKEPAQPISFELFPNPSNGITTVKTAGEAIQSYRITDVQGKLIQFWETVPRDNININLEGNPDGLYFIHLKIQDGWHQARLLKY